MNTPIRYTVEQGARDPIKLRVIVSAADVPIEERVVADLRDVTEVSLTMTNRRTGAVETWTMAIAEQTEEELVLDHPYQLADTATLRTLRGVPWMTVTGAANPVAAPSFDLQIVER